ncbi:hypothetical protein Back2_15990 [Nocardioides baekrokdamisoli]|uniref:DUF732 domain-containing protein n=1 Tax=Nocardioides baekrokdamisoli TaxID=1804624 RepID=A0A3G9IGC0_9ACTN|nr:hypothetical protein [Nocardioides baekrokdamisoli]BBH17312.1 hypothetical protein Back2_15990 [Nocardioides baekrokdamisoli]
MTSRSAYALGMAVAMAVLTACGSSSAGGGSSPTIGPSTPDGLPPIRTSPFPTVSVAPSDEAAVAQCRVDVTEVTNATELYHRQNGIYAPDMKTLVFAGLLKSVPSDIHYGYDAPDVDPVVLGTVTGC